MSPRVPPLVRQQLHPPLSLSPEDEALLRQFRRHRFLRAGQVARLTGLPLPAVTRRLGVLFRHGYLDRPLAQARPPWKSGAADLVHGLGRRGARHLLGLGDTETHRIHEKRVGEAYLEHALEVAEFMTRLEAELPPGVSLRYEDESFSMGRSVASCSWTVPVHYRGERLDVGVVPDRVFRLETRDESLVFCLEIDRGTMPVVRTNPGQSSFYRKLLAYHETWRSGLHVSELGWRRFRVLTLTSSPERRDHLVSVCAEVVAGGGSGLFMFAEKGQAGDCADLASVQWLTGDGTNVAKLLSETRG
jgi:hypothetical protein